LVYAQSCSDWSLTWWWPLQLSLQPSL
jgi:hypothetical protein